MNTFLQAVKIAYDTIPGLKHDMDRLRDLRKSDNHKDMDGIGRMALSIPDPIKPLLKAYFPELYQDDQQLAAVQWKRFIKSADSLPFRVAGKI